MVTNSTDRSHYLDLSPGNIKINRNQILVMLNFHSKLKVPQLTVDAVPTLVCQGPSFYLKFLVKTGHNSKTIASYSIQSYAHGHATAPCHDEQVFQIKC